MRGLLAAFVVAFGLSLLIEAANARLYARRHPYAGCDCPDAWCAASKAGVPMLHCRRRRRRLLVLRTLVVAIIAGAGAALTLAIWRRL